MSDAAFARIEGTPELRVLYQRLLDVLDGLGSYQVQHHKSGIHIVRISGFLAVSPTEQGLRLRISTSDPELRSKETTVSSAADIDALAPLLADAYRVAG